MEWIRRLDCLLTQGKDGKHILPSPLSGDCKLHIFRPSVGSPNTKTEKRNRQSAQTATDNKNLRSDHVIFFAINFSVYIVKRLASQRSGTRTADETVGVIQIAHCLASGSSTSHFITARVTNAWNFWKKRPLKRNGTETAKQNKITKIFALLFVPFHFLFQLARQFFNLQLGLRWTSRTRRRYIIRKQILCEHFICSNENKRCYGW